MNRIVLYHGSESEIISPKYGLGDPNSDYGRAFYCTRELEAAKEWANKRSNHGLVNKYAFDGRGLKVLDLTDKNIYNVLHWFAILMHFRHLDPIFKEEYRKELDYLEKHYYIDINQYDVVIGFRADDSYFTFPLMFIRSEIRLERLETIYKIGYLGVQIAIVSQKAFARLKHLETLMVSPIYHDKYHTRISLADARFKEISKEERYLSGTRMIDMVKKDD